MNGERPGRVCLFGAAPDTGNLGLSALCYSVLSGLARRSSLEPTVFDYGRGMRRGTFRCDSQDFEFERCGAAHTRRYYRSESLWNIRFCGWFGGLTNIAARRIREARAILDISGGDSFTDLYGPRRFRSMVLPKLLALEQKKKLVLLPQTYGPYANSRFRRIACDIIRRAGLAWARDARSFETLKELAAQDFDSQRHRCGVDVAFTLEPRRASLSNIPAGWLDSRSDRETIGFNVSGLIFNNPYAAAQRYALLADYPQAVIRFLRRVLQETDVNVVLIPHVLTPAGHYESDVGANAAVAESLADVAKHRLLALPPEYDQSQMKWIISRLGWFCGTRMHAAIAALSSHVPTAAIAYSVKTRGVFESCHQGDYVADPRILGTEGLIEHLWTSFADRDTARRMLNDTVPSVLSKAEEQMDGIVEYCLGP